MLCGKYNIILSRYQLTWFKYDKSLILYGREISGIKFHINTSLKYISISGIENYWSGHTRLDTSSSFPNLEIKQSRATSVLGWATSRERAVLLPFSYFFFNFFSLFIFCIFQFYPPFLLYFRLIYIIEFIKIGRILIGFEVISWTK